MLSGMGNPPERRSKRDMGGEEGGCSLQPGPDKFYLDGEDMQTKGKGICGRASGVVSYTRGQCGLLSNVLCNGDAVACEWWRGNPCRS